MTWLLLAYAAAGVLLMAASVLGLVRINRDYRAERARLDARRARIDTWVAHKRRGVICICPVCRSERRAA